MLRARHLIALTSIHPAGPLIYAEAGSTVQIMFRNALPGGVAVNMEPAGGATWSAPAPGFLPPIQPGQTTVLRWRVRAYVHTSHACAFAAMPLPHAELHACSCVDWGLSRARWRGAHEW
jgi:hypothetical protein